MFPSPSYPTPVRACPELGNARAELWVKNDGLSHPSYGGNKVRKAERIVTEALRRGSRRVLSFGAVGSHHLLTLTLFARAAGLGSAAVVFSQPNSAHALDTFRASLGAGLEAYPARSPLSIPWVLARAWRRGDYVVAPGGSNLIGARACAAAVTELREQISKSVLPCPDLIVVPLGSGGTFGGIAAGVMAEGLATRVLGVQVVGGPGPRLAGRWLARRVLQATGFGALTGELDRRLAFDADYVGAGYGVETEAGVRATAIANELGLALDQTYTAKAFAKVLDLLANASPVATERGSRPLRILYWHTLAATSLDQLLHGAPNEKELPKSLRQLLR